ncbi:AMIN-like domain-containing (lipo)protein [Pseudarthrobacter sp. So.54]
MSAMSGVKIHVSARNAGVGMLALLLALTACTPSTPQPGGTSQPAASPASSSAAPSTTSAPSASATVPADSDGTAPPQSGDKVISSKIVLDWTWPGPGNPFKATHENPVPISPPLGRTLPTLYAIGAGKHPADTPPYDQLSFRFQGGFPGYDIEFVPELIADGSGLPVPMPGTGAILKVAFRGAQAHTADGTASTITSTPAPAIGYPALTSYAAAGDFEGILSYGIGVGLPVGTVPQTKMRVYEVEKIEAGRHLYVVAVQLDTTPWK